MQNQKKTGHILIVDDDRMMRMMLSRALAQQGHSFEAVENGVQALEKLATESFDVVLCDIEMPGMNGFEVLEHIMSDAALRQIPVIMVSGMGDMAAVVKCIERGAADYIHKPFDAALLRARLDNCLEKKNWHEQELALHRKLEEKYHQLQELEQSRDSLTHMIVHDLRTPLTSFLTGLQSAECLGDLNEDQQECIGMSISGGQQLLGMINDLLDVGKMEDGSLSLDLKTADVATLVEKSSRQVASLAGDKNLRLVSEISEQLPMVRLDEDKIVRALVNLIGNAIKFTPVAGQITVAVRPDEDAHTIRFSVRDTGEGIPQEAFGRIFEKFGQVETRKMGRTMSTGLGLTFCKMVAEAHGGRIWVESELGQGSTFSFTIVQCT